jgi:hypothetical protein
MVTRSAAASDDAFLAALDRRAVIADDEEASGQKRGPSDPDIERRNGF